MTEAVKTLAETADPMRRTLIKGAAALAVGVMSGRAIAAPSPDAELLARLGEFDALQSDLEQHCDDDQTHAILSRMGQMAATIHRLRSTTLEAHSARARSILGTFPDFVDHPADTDELMIAALLRDLAGSFHHGA